MLFIIKNALFMFLNQSRFSLCPRSVISLALIYCETWIAIHNKCEYALTTMLIVFHHEIYFICSITFCYLYLSQFISILLWIEVLEKNILRFRKRHSEDLYVLISNYIYCRPKVGILSILHI